MNTMNEVRNDDVMPNFDDDEMHSANVEMPKDDDVMMMDAQRQDNKIQCKGRKRSTTTNNFGSRVSNNDDGTKKDDDEVHSFDDVMPNDAKRCTWEPDPLPRRLRRSTRTKKRSYFEEKSMERK